MDGLSPLPPEWAAAAATSQYIIDSVGNVGTETFNFKMLKIPLVGIGVGTVIEEVVNVTVSHISNDDYDITMGEAILSVSVVGGIEILTKIIIERLAVQNPYFVTAVGLVLAGAGTAAYVASLNGTVWAVADWMDGAPVHTKFFDANGLNRKGLVIQGGFKEGETENLASHYLVQGFTEICMEAKLQFLTKVAMK